MKDKIISGKLTFCEFENYDGPHISLWMGSEEMENSSRSIEMFVGRRGNFEAKEFDIFKHNSTILLVVKGKCPLANETRTAAELKRKRNYNQHMTVGIFKNLELPRDVIKIQFNIR